jgi:hypothetical protein
MAKQNYLPPVNWRWVEEGDGRLQPSGQPLGVPDILWLPSMDAASRLLLTAAVSDRSATLAIDHVNAMFEATL